MSIKARWAERENHLLLKTFRIFQRANLFLLLLPRSDLQNFSVLIAPKRRASKEAATSATEVATPPPVIERPIGGREFSRFPEIFIPFQSRPLVISW